MTSTNDISFILSGGTTNINPNASLGGNPSSTAIVDNSIDNLFDDVTAAENQSDYTDYRCFYVFNDGTSAIYNVNIWIADDFVGGANLALGIEDRDEIQRIVISDTATGGSFTIIYRTLECYLTVDYNPDPGVWATNLQTALNNHCYNETGGLLLSTVQVAAHISGGFIYFDITFADKDGKRVHPSLLLASNNLTPSTTISIHMIQSGAPVNSVAADIGVATNPPGGITFCVPTSDSPITLPRLDSSDGFSMWVKRTVAAGLTAVERDGVTIRLSAGTLAS